MQVTIPVIPIDYPYLN